MLMTAFLFGLGSGTVVGLIVGGVAGWTYAHAQGGSERPVI